MTPNRFLLLAFLSPYLFSCDDKDPALFNYPSVYNKTQLEATSDFRIFDVNGEITDPAVIEHFIYGDTSFYNSFLRYAIDYRVMDTLKFVDGAHVKLHHHGYEKECTVDTEGKTVILTNEAITKSCCSYPDVYSRTFAYKLGKVKPEVYEEYIERSTGGIYYFNFSIREKFVLTKSNGKLVAPMILYLVHKDNETWGILSGYINNIPDPEFYKSLGEGEIASILEIEIQFEEMIE